MTKKLTNQNKKELLNILKERFEKNKVRHQNINWENVEQRLETLPEKLGSLNEMELSGGEPDVVEYDTKTDEYIFIDCSEESPIGRRSFCYDQEALDSRKANKPNHSAIGFAEEIGISILDEEQYRKYHPIIGFDNKTSSWVQTPKEVRALGGAIFCDYRFGRIFTYHNGAESYYAARGFRGILKV